MNGLKWDTFIIYFSSTGLQLFHEEECSSRVRKIAVSSVKRYQRVWESFFLVPGSPSCQACVDCASCQMLLRKWLFLYLFIFFVNFLIFLCHCFCLFISYSIPTRLSKIASIIKYRNQPLKIICLNCLGLLEMKDRFFKKMAQIS